MHNEMAELFKLQSKLTNNLIFFDILKHTIYTFIYLIYIK